MKNFNNSSRLCYWNHLNLHTKKVSNERVGNKHEGATIPGIKVRTSESDARSRQPVYRDDSRIYSACLVFFLFLWVNQRRTSSETQYFNDRAPHHEEIGKQFLSIYGDFFRNRFARERKTTMRGLYYDRMFSCSDRWGRVVYFRSVIRQWITSTGDIITC